jgi:regulation of enolase protein 1 (concanavalin A-like superfamily)
MNPNRLAGAALLITAAACGFAPPGDLHFRDTFNPKPDAGWKWVRDDPRAWRSGPGGLEVLIQPGNNWGPANDGKNTLVRPAPDPKAQPVEITATVSNNPTNQWEQVDLAWYYDDSNMVKLGQEMVDGQLSIVMGREQGDKARTVKIIPLDSTDVQLCLTVTGNTIRGRFKTPKADWRDVGECDLPTPPPSATQPKVSLQFYNGLPSVQHWAKVSEVTVRTPQ